MRRLGARLLWRLADPADGAPVARLIELAGDRDEEVRYAALGGLYWYRGRADVRAIAEERAKDSSTDVRAIARAVLDDYVGKVRE